MQPKHGDIVLIPIPFTDLSSQTQRPVIAVAQPAGHAPDQSLHVEQTHSLMVRVEDLDRHYAHVAQCGARIISPPTDFPYGERQYTAKHLVGRRWTFSQSIADVDPQAWGGALREGADDTTTLF